MRRFPPFIAIVVLLPLVIQARDVYYQGALTPLNTLPTFDKGYLAVYDEDHVIALYGPDGSLAYRAKAQAPGEKPAEALNLNASPDADGALAIAVEYRLGKSTAGGVAVFDPKGTQSAFIDTGTDWMPTHVCFGPDHSVWAVGRRGYEPAASVADSFVLRNYSRDGRLLGAFLPRSSFARDPASPNIGGWKLRSANGRIGVYLQHSTPSGTSEWIEVDLLGKVVRRVEMQERMVTAFSDDGSVYARRYQGGFAVLNPAVNSWQPFSGAHGDLLGADGDSLVFLKGVNLLVWSPR